MQALKCDRCKTYYDSEENQKIYVREKGHDSYDLCDACYAELLTWLGIPEEEPTPEEPADPTVDPDPTTAPTTDPTTDPDTSGDSTDPDTEPTTDPSEGGDDNG